MDTNRFFSKEEKQMLIPLYRKLLQLSGDTLLPGDCRKLKHISWPVPLQKPYNAMYSG